MDIRRVLPFLLFVLILLIPGRALAQGAWVPREGEAAFSISYQWLDAKRHAIDNSGLSPFEAWLGQDFDSNQVTAFGRVSAMSMVLDAEVGVTDRLTLTGGLAFITSRYLGDIPETPTDADGQFHGTVQDARIAARYAAVNDGTWSVTPFAAFVFPATDYAVFGQTAPGLGLNELQVGATVGRLLDIRGSPRAWFQGAYYYAFMENVSEEITVDRSNLNLELGYFVNERLSVNLLTNWQKVHGGIEWKNISHPTLSPADLLGSPHLDDSFHAHDRAAATHEWRWGGGVSFQVSETVEVYGSINSFLWGVNTYNARTFNFGVNVSAQLWGGGGLGMWASDNDPDADMDDWLLEDFEDDGDGKNENENDDENKNQEKTDGESL